MELFDITKIIFEKPGEWTNVTPGEKRKYYFAIQRRFAIQFPMQANALQQLKINQSAVIDFWQRFMRQKYDRTPGWMYTKGIKKAKAIKEKKNNNINEALISQYASKLNIDRKSVYDALEFYPDLMTAEILSFKKMIDMI